MSKNQKPTTTTQTDMENVENKNIHKETHHKHPKVDSDNEKSEDTKTEHLDTETTKSDLAKKDDFNLSQSKDNNEDQKIENEKESNKTSDLSDKDENLKESPSDSESKTAHKVHHHSKHQKNSGIEGELKSLRSINIFLLASVLLLTIITTIIAVFGWFKVDELTKTQNSLKTELTAQTSQLNSVKSDSVNLKTTLKPVLDQLAQLQPQKPAPTSLAVPKPDLTTEFYRGNGSADVVWIEYSDLECPFCGKLHPDLVKITAEYPQIAWIYRHLPLEKLHPETKTYSLAVECVAKQKGGQAYWQMIDSLMAGQQTLNTASLPAKAAEYGVDQAAFKQCMDNKETMPIIDAQMNGFISAIGDNQFGTPASVLYNQKTGRTKYISGALPYATLKAELEKFIQEG